MCGGDRKCEGKGKKRGIASSSKVVQGKKGDIGGRKKMGKGKTGKIMVPGREGYGGRARGDGVTSVRCRSRGLESAVEKR